MNARWMLSRAAFAAVLLSTSLPATAAESNMDRNQSPTHGSARVIENSALIGTTVLDSQGQAVGRIKNLLLDNQTGQAVFVVVDAKSAPANHATFVLPYRALRLSFNPADNRLRVAIDQRPNRMYSASQMKIDRGQQVLGHSPEQAPNLYQLSSYPAVPTDTLSAPCPPAPCAEPPSRNSSYAGWPQSLIDFSSE
jgi:sporulation protein YlmC with PRC-barrel domain